MALFYSARRYHWSLKKIILRVERFHHEDVQPGEVGPDGRVVSLVVLVPRVATTALPDGCFQFGLYLLIEPVVHVLFDFGTSNVLLLHVEKCFGDVLELGLDHDDHRIVTEASVWTEQNEEIRKVGHRNTPVRLRERRRDDSLRTVRD